MSAYAGYESVVQRVLGIPEIVELIFGFLDDEDNMSNAIVCKRWSGIALNMLWREVTNLRRLFILLAPLKIKGEVYEFTRGLEGADWERFKSYARRVRALEFNELDEGTYLSQDAFDEVCRTRVSLNTLPNLRSLTWLAPSSDRLRFSLVFMHENITQFAVYLHQSDTYPIKTFFKEVILRMPRLTQLDLRFDFCVRDIQADIIELLRGLPLLKRVVLPLYTITTKVMEELSRHAHVGTIQFEFMESQGRGDVKDVSSFAPRLEEGAFPSLWDLSLSATLQDSTRFLTSSFAPSNLTILYIHVLSTSSPSDMSAFLTAVSENCQLLTHLYIDYFTPPPSATLGTDVTSTVTVATEALEDEGEINSGLLNWQALRPLLSFPNLVEFELRWNLPLELTQDDMEELSSKWPSLEVLLLNCEPMDVSIPPTLTLEALIPFAKHCPKLRELGLYVSTFTPLHLSLDVLAAIKPFQSLQRLSMGLSHIDSPGDTALFLSRLCPVECELTSGVTWPDGFGLAETPLNLARLDEMSKEAAGWFEKWNEVAKMLPHLTRVRVEEGERRKTLQEEVEDLRIRCQILAERAGEKFAGDGTCIVS